MYPSREEFTELIYYISELKHQYSSKIDEQTIKINDQSGVIEELLFQIRELSDKLRQMNQKVILVEKSLADTRRKIEDTSCVCRYENHIPGHVIPNRSIFSRQTSMISNRNTARVAKKDKTSNIREDENDVYETIEFSDSSSNVYTEPVREYGVLRKINIKTSPKQRQAIKKPPSGLKKSSGSKNLQKFTAMQDVSRVAEEDGEPTVELRVKPYETTVISQPDNRLISDIETQFTHSENMDPTFQRDVSGILINFECSSSRNPTQRNEFGDRVSL